ncbi:peptidoglycan-binding protein [Streptomyces sp. MUSC 14]|uniref:peptidoglycan-binding domain-containing protein n=1 Tax=Streptomyces sp. MUSC 14 TaxID=1354889 RepID=UPI0008F56FC4|nr:peptidoglycan-binding domain-containing protein [Streptomyces sp. MUSC 14]OIK00386.1 peptidoglycan-binding protein [Streptomyces sp. MUSC 14]
MPTPSDPERPQPGPVLEPVRVLRPRRFDALAELMREIRPDPVTYEPLGRPAGPRPITGRAAPVAEDDTQELPPAPAAAATAPALGVLVSGAPVLGAPASGASVSGPPAPSVRVVTSRLRRAAVAVAVAVAALVGFGCAMLLPSGQGSTASAATATPSRPATTAPPASGQTPAAPGASTAAIDPDGPGTLRQGDTGPDVAELQERLLRIPDVYRDGSTDGTYDATLTAAVARFQLWYGISGDERGVYGDDTRRALESRTSRTPLGDGS